MDCLLDDTSSWTMSSCALGICDRQFSLFPDILFLWHFRAMVSKVFLVWPASEAIISWGFLGPDICHASLMVCSNYQQQSIRLQVIFNGTQWHDARHWRPTLVVEGLARGAKYQSWADLCFFQRSNDASTNHRSLFCHVVITSPHDSFAVLAISQFYWTLPSLLTAPCSWPCLTPL